MSKIYLICPVRNATESQLSAMNSYVAGLEAQGNKVHYPPRDVKQENDDGGIRICREHMEAMACCDEVHIWWDEASKGSHFDLGMAVMMSYQAQRHRASSQLKFRLANSVFGSPQKSFSNVVLAAATGMTGTEWRNRYGRVDTDRQIIDAEPIPRNSEDRFLDHLSTIAEEDAAGLKKAWESYGNSWKERGGVGAFMMLARKWDRLQNRVKKLAWDIFRAIKEDTRGEGAIDDVRDLRRYLMLVEAEMRAQGFERTHRDNGSLPRCNRAPPTGYAPCTRDLGHPGPCALPLAE